MKQLYSKIISLIEKFDKKFMPKYNLYFFISSTLACGYSILIASKFLEFTDISMISDKIKPYTHVSLYSIPLFIFDYYAITMIVLTAREYKLINFFRPLIGYMLIRFLTIKFFAKDLGFALQFTSLIIFAFIYSVYAITHENFNSSFRYKGVYRLFFGLLKTLGKGKEIRIIKTIEYHFKADTVNIKKSFVFNWKLERKINCEETISKLTDFDEEGNRFSLSIHHDGYNAYDHMLEYRVTETQEEVTIDNLKSLDLHYEKMTSQGWKLSKDENDLFWKFMRFYIFKDANLLLRKINEQLQKTDSTEPYLLEFQKVENNLFK